MSHRFDPTVLREYDIRGVFGETLRPQDAYALGRTFGSLVRRKGGSRIVVGYDGRLSSPELEQALVDGLIASGVNVVRIGVATTPMLYYAEATLEDVEGGIQVTGSHNPPDHNGFKIVLAGRPFFGADIRRLGEFAAAGEWENGSTGEVSAADILECYVQRLLGALDGIPADELQAARIGWDAGNGAAGPAVELLTGQLPGTHVAIYTKVDGSFPNHHPDPSKEANLADLKALVAANNLDFGVAFDGDADRIGAVDGLGRTISPDRLLAIYAEDVLARRPGATVIADVKTSQSVFGTIEHHGGRPVMWKTGHSLIKAKMRETGALLAGEMSGHMFFKDDYFGFDDGLYAALRLIAASVRLGRSVTDLQSAAPALVITPELRFQVDKRRKFAAIEEVRDRLQSAGARMVDIDGVRVSTDDGWWLLRASNTEEALVARAEATTSEALARLVAQIDAQLALSGISRAG